MYVYVRWFVSIVQLTCQNANKISTPLLGAISFFLFVNKLITSNQHLVSLKKLRAVPPKCTFVGFLSQPVLELVQFLSTATGNKAKATNCTNCNCCCLVFGEVHIRLHCVCTQHCVNMLMVLRQQSPYFALQYFRKCQIVP